MEFILLASAHFLALLSPGPDFFLIVRTALQKPLRHAYVLSAGIALANAIYLLIAIVGLELVKQYPMVLLVIKYLGVLFLLFVGAMLIKSPKISLENNQKIQSYQTSSLLTDFVIGFLSGFLNPKNMVF